MWTSGARLTSPAALSRDSPADRANAGAATGTTTSTNSSSLDSSGKPPSPTRIAASYPPASISRIAIEQPEPEVHVAERLLERVQARHDPLLGDTGVGRQHERGAVLSLRADLVQADLDRVETGSHLIEQSSTERRQPAAIGGAFEQVHAEAAFEGPDLTCHRRLRHPQVGGRRREAAEPGRRLEHRQPLQPVHVPECRSHGAVQRWCSMPTGYANPYLNWGVADDMHASE